MPDGLPLRRRTRRYRHVLTMMRERDAEPRRSCRASSQAAAAPLPDGRENTLHNISFLAAFMTLNLFILLMENFIDNISQNRCEKSSLVEASCVLYTP